MNNLAIIPKGEFATRVRLKYTYKRKFNHQTFNHTNKEPVQVLQHKPIKSLISRKRHDLWNLKDIFNTASVHIGNNTKILINNMMERFETEFQSIFSIFPLNLLSGEKKMITASKTVDDLISQTLSSETTTANNEPYHKNSIIK